MYDKRAWGFWKLKVWKFFFFFKQSVSLLAEQHTLDLDLAWEVLVCNFHFLRSFLGTSLVEQWLRVHLLMQGTWVWFLVWEDPTCRAATRPMRHNYWACVLEPLSDNYWVCTPQLLKPARRNYWTHVLQLLKPPHLEPMLFNKRIHRNEKPAHHNKE